MKKMLFIINDLNNGGAELNLFYFIKYCDKTFVNPTVVSLSGAGFYCDKISDLGVEVIKLDFKKHPFSSYFSLKKLVKQNEIINCWMYHSNFLGYLMVRHTKGKTLIWNIRHSNINKKYEKRLTYSINRFCSKHSDKVDVIFYNGERSKRVHSSFGYKNKNIFVIQNGCDVEFFNGDTPVFPSDLLFLQNHSPIIISVGRNHPIKDPETFIKMLCCLKEKHFSFKALLCGKGYEKDNDTIISLCKDYNLVIDDDIFLLGQRNDVNELMALSDYYVLHSVSEAFPNTLMQAMASKCICVSTDVGDAADILENKSLVCSVGDYEGLANKIIEFDKLSNIEKNFVKHNNREIIVKKYNIKQIVNTYQDIVLSFSK